jgi:hypothetical protein
MTTPETKPQMQAVTVAPRREIRVVEDDSAISYLLDTAKFEHICRIANLMASANLIPSHLKGDTKEQTQANCFLVVNQALRWGFDPFAVAPETYAISGKLGYQGKLIAAVINARGGLAEKLSYTFTGKGDDMEVTVSGRLEGEDAPRKVSVSVKQAKTQNQMWTKDPEQKLVYTGAIRWARRHKPEVVMGVLTEEDLDTMREEARIASLKNVKSPVIDAPQLTEPEPAPQTWKDDVAAMNAVVEQSRAASPVKPKRDAKGRPTLVEEPLDKPPIGGKSPEIPAPTEPQPTAAVPAAEPPVAAPPSLSEKVAKAVSKLKAMAAGANFTDEQFLTYLKRDKWLKKETIEETGLPSLEALIGLWKSKPDVMMKRIADVLAKASEGK